MDSAMEVRDGMVTAVLNRRNVDQGELSDKCLDLGSRQ